MKFSQYLEIKFLEWQQKQGGRKTIAEFAAYLGIAQTTASSYMNGVRKPEGEKLREIAHKLGFEVYDVLGLPRPDEDLAYISQHWDTISEEFRRKFRKEVEEQLDLEQLSKAIASLEPYLLNAPSHEVNNQLRSLIDRIELTPTTLTPRIIWDDSSR